MNFCFNLHKNKYYGNTTLFRLLYFIKFNKYVGIVSFFFTITARDETYSSWLHVGILFSCHHGYISAWIRLWSRTEVSILQRFSIVGKINKIHYNDDNGDYYEAAQCTHHSADRRARHTPSTFAKGSTHLETANVSLLQAIQKITLVLATLQCQNILCELCLYKLVQFLCSMLREKKTIFKRLVLEKTLKINNSV